MPNEVVIAIHRPKPGMDAALREIFSIHVPTLRALGLVTSRPVTLLRAADGSYLEIFEWVEGGAEKAHHDPQVLAIWNRFSESSDMLPLTALPAADRPFPHFTAVDGVTA
jgi:hypothetical protein